MLNPFLRLRSRQEHVFSRRNIQRRKYFED
jgi:hypothetical protein